MISCRWMNRFTVGLLLLTSVLTTGALACTGIQLKAVDGSYVNGRTVEFGIPLDISAVFIPRNYAFNGTLPDGSPGMAYRAKYAVVGAGVFGRPEIVDGLNEKGLSAGMFYFPGYASYTPVTPENKKNALAPTEFVNWILTGFASVDEVKKALQSVVIVPVGATQWGGVPPFHYIVYDRAGNSLVIEPLDGALVVRDNPVGVVTNSPTFDWHMTNLSNYLNLSPFNAPAKTVDGVKITQFGQGSGLRGLPGDFTPPSRFVRAVIYSASAIPASNSQQAVFDAFHILNQFDIPVGAVRGEDHGKIVSEFTLATTVKDPQGLKYYFRTYDDQTIRVIEMSAFDLNDSKFKSVRVQGSQPVVNISGTMH